jgi:hypothetical protein
MPNVLFWKLAPPNGVYEHICLIHVNVASYHVSLGSIHDDFITTNKQNIVMDEW